jgi:hypothetical protein
MRPAQLAHRGVDLDRGLVRTELGPMRPVDQPTQAVIPIAGQPRVHGLARHPDLRGHCPDRLPGQHGQHRPIALLDNGQLDKHRSRPPAARRPQTTYSQQADHGHCQPSGETDVSSINRSRTGHGTLRLPNQAMYGSRAPAGAGAVLGRAALNQLGVVRRSDDVLGVRVYATRIDLRRRVG